MKKTLSVFGLFFFLSSCGFQPLYLPMEKKIQSDLASFTIHPPQTRSGQVLRFYMEDELSLFQTYNKGKDKRLTISLTESIINSGIRSDASATKGTLTITAVFSLTHHESKTLLHKGHITRRTTFRIDDSPYVNYQTEKDAIERNLRLIGKDLVQNLALFFKNENQGKQ